MRKYEVYVSISDKGEDGLDAITSTRKMSQHDDVEGVTNIGWCFGCTIAEAIWSLQGIISHTEFDDIFNAIQMVKEDFDKTKESVCPKVKPTRTSGEPSDL